MLHLLSNRHQRGKQTRSAIPWLRQCVILVGLCTAIITGGFSAQAHEVWIAPETYTPAPNSPLTANIRNGEQFVGSALIYNAASTDALQVISPGGTTRAINGRLGDVPAVRLEDGLQAGLNVLAYQSTPSSLTYTQWQKFTDFAAHKDFKNIQDRHDARGLPRTGFVETYTRFSKALIGVGEAEGQDRALGLETELVALDNPYTKAPDQPVRVRALYQGKPRADVQVELFAKAPDGTVAVTLHRTDDAGIAALPVTPGTEYLVDAVVLRTPVDAAAKASPQAVWETLWAALTFKVPQSN